MSLFSFLEKKKARIHLDYAAGTPLRTEVFEKMLPFYRDSFANASSLYGEGRLARDVVEDARLKVSRILKVRSEEVFFVGGGTEANNLAIGGLFEALRAQGRSLSECEVLTTAIEHPSILEVLKHYESLGLTVSFVPVSEEGLVERAVFEKMLSQKVVLVTFAYANSEIGVVQDVKMLTRSVRAFRAKEKTPFPYVHLDASQAPLYLSCAFDSLGIDMMTLDAGKFYGPKGVGVFVKKHAVPCAPLFYGGDQEMGMRPGTENVPGIVGCAAALCIAERDRERRVLKVAAVRDFGFERFAQVPGVVVNGSQRERIAHNINISIPGIDGEYAAVVLDTAGIAVGTKSACSGATGSGSKVIYALGGDDARALSTLRITLGEETTKRNIEACARVLEKHVKHMRETLDQIKKK